MSLKESFNRQRLNPTGEYQRSTDGDEVYTIEDCGRVSPSSFSREKRKILFSFKKTFGGTWSSEREYRVIGLKDMYDYGLG